MSKLASFRQDLQASMNSPHQRPFLCEGDPFQCSVFIVGFNPATKLERPFWDNWSDEQGLNKQNLMEDYLHTRKLAGVRPRIQAIVDQLKPHSCLETNICSVPTKRASDLARSEIRTTEFEYLFVTLKPKLVFLHSNQPIAYFKDKTGEHGFGETPTNANWHSHNFKVMVRPGPLWRASIEGAAAIGRKMATALG